MKNMMVILKHNLKSVLKSWFAIVIIFPIIINLIVYLPMKISKENSGGVKLGVYTQDNSDIYEKIISKEKFKEIETLSSREELLQMIEDGDLLVGVVVNSKDIYEDLKNNKENLIEIIEKDGEVEKLYVESVIKTSLTQVMSFGNTKEEVLKSYDDYEVNKYKFEYEDSDLEELIGYKSMFGFFCMAFLFIAGRGISPLLKEREINIDKRILVSKVKKWEYQCGHILGCFVLLIMQSVTLVIGMRFINTSFDINIVYMLILSFALSVVGIAVALFTLSLSKNSTMYYTLLSIIATPMALLSGGFVPLEFMPETMQKIAMISPLAWVNTAFEGILLNKDLTVVGTNLLAAVSLSILFIVLFLIIDSKKKNIQGY